MANLPALLERVTAASGADREIDIALQRLTEPKDFFLYLTDCGLDPGYYREEGETADYWTVVLKDDVGFSANAGLRKRTASIDAALALVEKVKPGWIWTVHSNGYEIGAQLAPSYGCWEPNANGATPALAILAALLRSLISKEESSPSPQRGTGREEP